ncbi:MAG TPA: hypothetical protein VIK95_05350 [Egibacteraceae bacterium]
MHHVTHRPVRGLVAALVAALLAVGLLAAGASAQRGEKVPDGRALFEGLLLGSGEVAARLPEVFGDLPEMPREAAKVQDALLDAVAEHDPRLFPTLQKAVASGDHVAVQRALDAGSKALTEVITEGKLFRLPDDYVLPYVFTWHPFRWHYRWLPYRWTHWFDYGYDHTYDYDYDFDYDGRWRFRYVIPWSYELDPESQIANEKFVDLVVERFAL